jgi:hypothetical protein
MARSLELETSPIAMAALDAVIQGKKTQIFQ